MNDFKMEDFSRKFIFDLTTAKFEGIIKNYNLLIRCLFEKRKDRS
jgi:hypothetical protein